jgi:hypothetical protein
VLASARRPRGGHLPFLSALADGSDCGEWGGNVRTLERLITELAQICREALGSWQRTGQLTTLIFAIALGAALVLWVTHS